MTPGMVVTLIMNVVLFNRSRCRRSSVERKGDDGLREIEVDWLKGRGSSIANIKVSLDYPGVLRPSGLYCPDERDASIFHHT